MAPPNNPNEKSGQTINDLDDTITKSAEGDRKLNDLVASLQSALLRVGEPHLPVWSSEWFDEKTSTTFKNHVKAFENYATLLQWDSEMKALKLQMTLRGGIREYIDTLSTDVKKDYDKLKSELMQVYHEEKDPSTKIQDWNLIVWTPNPPESMSLQCLGAIILTKFKSFAEKSETDELSEIMLKRRFLEAISEGDAKFASFIKLNLPAEKSSYKDLIAFCAKKYEIYKHLKNAEREREDYAQAETSSEEVFLQQDMISQRAVKDENDKSTASDEDDFTDEDEDNVTKHQ